MENNKINIYQQVKLWLQQQKNELYIKNLNITEEDKNMLLKIIRLNITEEDKNMLLKIIKSKNTIVKTHLFNKMRLKITKKAITHLFNKIRLINIRKKEEKEAEEEENKKREEEEKKKEEKKRKEEEKNLTEEEKENKKKKKEAEIVKKKEAEEAEKKEQEEQEEQQLKIIDKSTLNNIIVKKYKITENIANKMLLILKNPIFKDKLINLSESLVVNKDKKEKQIEIRFLEQYNEDLAIKLENIQQDRIYSKFKSENYIYKQYEHLDKSIAAELKENLKAKARIIDSKLRPKGKINLSTKIAKIAAEERIAVRRMIEEEEENMYIEYCKMQKLKIEMKKLLSKEWYIIWNSARLLQAKEDRLQAEEIERLQKEKLEMVKQESIEKEEEERLEREEFKKTGRRKPWRSLSNYHIRECNNKANNRLNRAKLSEKKTEEEKKQEDDAKIIIKDSRNRDYVRRYHFKLGKLGNTGRIYLRKSYTNIFVTFTDLSNKIIISKTSGSSGIKGSKRRKRVPLALESIIKSLSVYLKLYNILYVDIVLIMKINAYFYNLVKELLYYGINIRNIIMKRKIAFNGVKCRKSRNV